MNRTKSMISLAIAFAFVFSVFAGAMAPADAITISPENNRNIEIDYTNLDDSPLVVGEQDVDFYVNVDNDAPGGDADDDSPIQNCNLAISTSVRDEEGYSITTPISNWDTYEVNDAATIGDWDDHNFWGFQFDLKSNAVPRTDPEYYNLTVTLSYENETGVTCSSYVGYILFEVSERANVGDISGLKPGDNNKAVSVLVQGDNDMSGIEYMEDITLTVTRPNADFSWYGTTSASASAVYGGQMDEFDMYYFPFTLSVDSDTDAGEYTGGTYTITYTNEDDISCTETGEITFTVGQLAMLTITASVSSIEQGTTTIILNLTITNTGTVDLFDIKIYIDPASDAFTFVPADHWEDAETVSTAGVDVGDLVVGGSVMRDMPVGVNMYIPEGLHKIMFGFDGIYYDPDAQTYQTTNCWWQNAPPYYPTVQMGMTTHHLTAGTSTIDGPFIWITVTDAAQTMEISITQNAGFTSVSLYNQLADQSLGLDLFNYGSVDYVNVVIQVHTGAASELFLNVVNSEASLSEEVIVGNLWAGNDDTVSVPVTLKADAVPGVYSIPVTLTGIDNDMGEFITSTVYARVTIYGVGAVLEVTSVSPETFKPGTDFTLTLTITNNGDDAARNVELNMATGGLDDFALLTGGNSDLDGDLAAPTPAALPISISDIAPGESITVDILMICNPDIADGHVFSIPLSVNYDGTYSSGGQDSLQVAIKSTGNGGSVISNYYWTLIILLIVVMICLVIGTIIHIKKFKASKPAPVVDSYQSAPPPPEIIEP